VAKTVAALKFTMRLQLSVYFEEVTKQRNNRLMGKQNMLLIHVCMYVCMLPMCAEHCINKRIMLAILRENNNSELDICGKEGINIYLICH
jgi:hypothetical protein